MLVHLKLQTTHHVQNSAQLQGEKSRIRFNSRVGVQEVDGPQVDGGKLPGDLVLGELVEVSDK